MQASDTPWLEELAAFLNGAYDAASVGERELCMKAIQRAINKIRAAVHTDPGYTIKVMPLTDEDKRQRKAPTIVLTIQLPGKISPS